MTLHDLSFKPTQCVLALVVILVGSFATTSKSYAQTGDAAVRVLQLEDEVRRLNGKVEELTFQLLQLQEQIRKMQQDNELRFQELEDGKESSAPSAANQNKLAQGTKSLEKPATSASTDAADDTPAIVDQTNAAATDQTSKPKVDADTQSDSSTPSTDTAAINTDDLTLNSVDEDTPSSSADAASQNTDTKAASDTVPTPAPDVATAPKTPEPKPVETAKRDLTPKSLGTLTFDANGNVVSAGRPIYSDQNLTKLPGVFNDGVDGGIEAAEYGPTPSAVIKAGQIALRNNRIDRAEGAFRAFLKAWPKDPDVPMVKTLLAQSLFQKQQYFDAANIFLDTHNKHPNNRMGAENLLGLGLSLAGLNQREVACATYAEVLKQYPADAARLGKRVEREQSAAKC